MPSKFRQRQKRLRKRERARARAAAHSVVTQSAAKPDVPAIFKHLEELVSPLVKALSASAN